MFDLDGTLVDSAPDIAISLNLALQQLNLPTRDIIQVRNWVGNGAARLIKRALTGEMQGEPEENLFQQMQRLFFDAYAQHICEESVVYPGVLEGLDTLRSRDIILAIVTNKPRRFTPALLQALNLQHFFQHVVCGDDLPVKKPDPQALHHILQKTQLQPSQSYMVGDSTNDIEAAKAAKIRSFCVTYGYSQLSGLDKGVDALGADYIIDSIAEIPNYLD